MVQTIIMTSDIQDKLLGGYCHQWRRYYLTSGDNLICGFRDFSPPSGFQFYSIGNFIDYPANKWSDALIKVLNEVAEEVFILMLDDYWLLRNADWVGIKIIYDYMRQFTNVIRFDLTTDRLYAPDYPNLSQEALDKAKGHIIANSYYYNMNTYATAGHLDLIKSTPNSHYHMSLWGAMWRRDLLKRIIVPGESAQEIEMNGTGRLSQLDNLLVLGTRQCPLRHGNVVQRGEWNDDKITGGLPALNDGDRKELDRLGYIK